MSLCTELHTAAPTARDCQVLAVGLHLCCEGGDAGQVGACRQLPTVRYDAVLDWLLAHLLGVFHIPDCPVPLAGHSQFRC